MSLLICTVNIKDRKSMDRSSKKNYFPSIRGRYILQSLNIPGKNNIPCHAQLFLSSNSSMVKLKDETLSLVHELRFRYIGTSKL